MKSKKGEGGLDLSMGALISLILVIGSLFVLWNLSANFWPDIGKAKREATFGNFDNLAKSIKENALPPAYPIYIKKGYIIVGFSKAQTIRLSCENPTFKQKNDVNPFLRKPTICGDQSCLCICENKPKPKNKDGVYRYKIDDGACSPQYGSVRCFTENDFGFDPAYEATFQGGTFTSGGSCNVAFVGGIDKNQEIFIQREGNTISICNEECESLEKHIPQRQDPLSVEDIPTLASTPLPTTTTSTSGWGTNIAIVGDSNSVPIPGVKIWHKVLADYCPEITIQYKDTIDSKSKDKYADNGKDTTQMRNDFEEVLAGNHDTIIFLGGSNTVTKKKEGWGEGKIEEDYTNMYQRAKEAGVNVIAVTSTPHRHVQWWSAEQHQAFEQAMQWILSKPVNVDAVVNIYAPLEDPSHPNEMNPPYRFRDNLHVNAAGYQVIADTIFREAFDGVCPTSQSGAAVASADDGSRTKTLSGKKVLLIGDSHSSHGEYGKKLHEFFTTEGAITHLYAQPGSRTDHWLTGRNKDVTFINEAGTKSTIATLPRNYMPQLREALQPDITVISLGTNMINQHAAGDNIIIDATRTIAQQAALSQEGCYWVGPPATENDIYEPRIEDAIVSIEATVSPYCNFIDATQYTDVTDLWDDEKIHFNPEGGRKMAIGIFGNIQASSSLT